MFSPVRGILDRLLRRRLKAPNDDGVVAEFRKTLGPCPVCSGPLTDHAHWRLAAVPLNRPTHVSRFADLVSAGRWEDAAREARCWASDQDVREYHAVRCPSGNGVGIVTVVFTHEFWSSDYVETARALAREDAARIEALARGHWQPL